MKGFPMSTYTVAALKKYSKVQKRIVKAVLEMSAAKLEFEILKHGPARDEDFTTKEWKSICEVQGWKYDVKFEDLCC